VLNRGLHLDGETADLLEVVLGTAAGALEGRVVNADRQPVPTSSSRSCPISRIVPASI